MTCANDVAQRDSREESDEPRFFASPKKENASLASQYLNARLFCTSPYYYGCVGRFTVADIYRRDVEHESAKLR
jgi:hypothetical protein